MSRETVAQPVQCYPFLDPSCIGRLMEQSVELSGRHRIANRRTGKQPAFRKRYSGIVACWSYLPPSPQEIEHLVGEHDVAIFASLRLLDANDLLRAVDLLDLKPNHFTGPQSAAISEAQHDPGLEARGNR